MAITLPHTFVDGVGNIASGEEVMDNLNALKAGVDALLLGPGVTTKDSTGVLGDGTRGSLIDVPGASLPFTTSSNTHELFVVTAQVLLQYSPATDAGSISLRAVYDAVADVSYGVDGIISGVLGGGEALSVRSSQVGIWYRAGVPGSHTFKIQGQWNNAALTGSEVTALRILRLSFPR